MIENILNKSALIENSKEDVEFFVGEKIPKEFEAEMLKALDFAEKNSEIMNPVRRMDYICDSLINKYFILKSEYK
ncbi:MAG: hypothetical protein WC376_03430 [Candidatus Nanoarchaeia archaeon]|jgi:hypothetical protein